LASKQQTGQEGEREILTDAESEMVEQMRSTKKYTKVATIVVLTATVTSDNLHRCLESIEKNTHLPYELFVLRDERKDFGFSRENNRIMRIAEGKYIVLLNDDCFVSEGWLEKMVSSAELSEDIGLVGARLYYPDGTIQTSGASFQYKNGMIQFFNDTSLRFESAAVVFALVLIKREVIEKVGFLDEKFTLGGEDYDYCYRATRSGFRIVTSEATAIHVVNASSKTVDASLRKQKGWVVFAQRYGVPPHKLYLRWLWIGTYPIRLQLRNSAPAVFVSFKRLRSLILASLRHTK
jgi:GT2 family glycosyltransferase